MPWGQGKHHSYLIREALGDQKSHTMERFNVSRLGANKVLACTYPMALAGLLFSVLLLGEGLRVGSERSQAPQRSRSAST